jgi:hypothetical protein
MIGSLYLLPCLFLVFFSLVFLPTTAHPGEAQLLQEINQQVWLPFLEGVNTGKDQLHVDGHSREFYLVAGGRNPRSMNFTEYEDDSGKVMQDHRSNNISMKVAVRFKERTSNQEFAREKCIFVFTSQEKAKAPQSVYSIANIFSRKENGFWKM